MKENGKNNKKKEKQLDNLTNLVERHTRTEHHLEQYGNIGEPKYKDMAREKQQIREEQIDELKDQLSGKKEVVSQREQFGNLVNNFEDTNEYVINNWNNMNVEELKNLDKKQDNRIEQMKNMLED